jgi:hypothetical protein
LYGQVKRLFFVSILKGLGMKKIALFNHKGGVGKTTLTVNIADALADFGKTVLIADADPQCNITSFYVEETDLEEMLGDSDDAGANTTLWSAVKPSSKVVAASSISQHLKFRQRKFTYFRAMFFFPTTKKNSRQLGQNVSRAAHAATTSLQRSPKSRTAPQRSWAQTFACMMSDQM